MKTAIPNHGCARCIWWQQRSRTKYGKCHLSRETRYYKFPPCEEYELDPMVNDTIDIGDEIHDGD